MTRSHEHKQVCWCCPNDTFQEQQQGRPGITLAIVEANSSSLSAFDKEVWRLEYGTETETVELVAVYVRGQILDHTRLFRAA